MLTFIGCAAAATWAALAVFALALAAVIATVAVLSKAVDLVLAVPGRLRDSGPPDTADDFTEWEAELAPERRTS